VNIGLQFPTTEKILGVRVEILEFWMEFWIPTIYGCLGILGHSGIFGYA